MRVIYNKIIPVKGFVAINLFGVIFARTEHMPISEKTISHEAIHTKQMRELLFVIFYLWYFVEWLIRLAEYKNAKEAYRNISFEWEAYGNAGNFEYLKTRKRYSFIKYCRFYTK